MKRITMILAVLVTVSVLGVSTPVTAAEIGRDGAISISQNDLKPGDLTAVETGDPDGMGTGNGLTDGDNPLLRTDEGALESVGGDEIEFLLYLMSLVELLAM